MNYSAAIRFPFQNPKWPMNLLCGGLCMLVPVVGPMVLIGYCIEVFTALRRSNYAAYPDFDFNLLTRYLSRGLFPMLVSMVLSLALIPIAFCCFFPTFFLIPFLAHDNHDAAPVFLFCCAAALYIPLIFIFNFIATPILLRAIIMQDFAKAFSFAFVRDFISRTGMQFLGMQVVTLLLGLAGAVVGLCLCVIGIYPVSALMVLIHYHLLAQLYDNYLARGGENLPLKETGAF